MFFWFGIFFVICTVLEKLVMPENCYADRAELNSSILPALNQQVGISY